MRDQVFRRYLRLKETLPKSVGRDSAREGHSVLGGPLIIGSQPFRYGIGVKASTKLIWQLDAEKNRYYHLAFYVGISAEQKRRASAMVEVWGDGKKLGQTPRFYFGESPRFVTADILHVRELCLVVIPGGDGNHNDSVILGELFVTNGSPSRIISLPPELVGHSVPSKVSNLRRFGRPAERPQDASRARSMRLEGRLFGEIFDERIPLNAVFSSETIPLGELTLAFRGINRKILHYQRTLDLSTGIAGVYYESVCTVPHESGDPDSPEQPFKVQHKRELFASSTGDVLVLRVTMHGDGDSAWLGMEDGGKPDRISEAGDMIVTGSLPERKGQGSLYQLRVRAFQQGKPLELSKWGKLLDSPGEYVFLLAVGTGLLKLLPDLKTILDRASQFSYDKQEAHHNLLTAQQRK